MKKHGFLYYLFIGPFLFLFTIYKHLFIGLSRLLEYIVDNFISILSEHPLNLRSLAYRIKELISYCYRRSITISRIMYISILTFNIVLTGLIFNSCVTTLQYIVVSILSIFVFALAIIIASLIFRAIDRIKHNTADTTALEIAITEDISDEISTDITNEDFNAGVEEDADMVSDDTINDETTQVASEFPEEQIFEEHIDDIPNDIPSSLAAIDDLQTDSQAAEDFNTITEAIDTVSDDTINEETTQVASEFPEEQIPAEHIDDIPNDDVPSSLAAIDDLQADSQAIEDFNVGTAEDTDTVSDNTINKEPPRTASEIPEEKIFEEHVDDIPKDVPSYLAAIDDLQTNSQAIEDFNTITEAIDMVSDDTINEETTQVASEFPEEQISEEHIDDIPKNVPSSLAVIDDLQTDSQAAEDFNAGTEVISNKSNYTINKKTNTHTFNRDIDFIYSCLRYVRNQDNLEDEDSRTHIHVPDATFENVGKYAISKKEITIQMIQNEFNISFFSACSMADKLEKYGVIGSDRGRYPRRILMSLDEFDKLLSTTTINSDDDATSSENFNDTSVNYDNMSGLEFEHFCADILRKNDFINVVVTQGSSDHGIDILAEKDSTTYAIQCKRYSSNVGNKAVQQAISGKLIYKKDIAVVLTNQYFTSQAIEDANSLKVELWNRNSLNELIKNANNSTQ